MEANRKRPLPSLTHTSSDFNGGRTESPHKKPRPRRSGLQLHDVVKSLRSHRVFSPRSELSRDMVNQKVGSEYGCAESESEQIRKGDLGFRSEDRGFGNGFAVSKGIEVSNGNGQNIDSDFKTKSLIKPCGRGKVFKTPGSLSYRRLLPYLINISEMNSCDGEIDRCPKLDKVLEEKKLQSAQSSQSVDASEDVSNDIVSVQCLNRQSNTMQKIVLDCTVESFDVHKPKLTSLETVALSPSTAAAEKYFSDPLVDGLFQGCDIELSSQNSMSDNSDSHVPIAAEDLLIAKDNVICMRSGDSKLKDNVAMIETIEEFSLLKDNVSMRETNDEFTGKVQDGEKENVNMSYTANGSYLHKDDELEKCSEDNMHPVIAYPVEKQTEIMDQKGRDGGDAVTQGDDLNEESNQMTPPDAETFVRLELEGNEADRPDYALHNRDSLNGKLSNRVNHEMASLVYDTRHDINSKCRGVPKPRSQMKLFRSPGSFSYRRMLPFLMDIAKDSSDAVINGPVRKSDKHLEEPAPLTSGYQEIPLNKSNVEFEENKKDVSAAPPVDVQTPKNDPTTEAENLMSAVDGTGFRVPLNAKAQELLHVEEVVSDVPKAFEMPTSFLLLQDNSRPVLQLCSTNSESKSKELAVSQPDQVTSEAEAGLSGSAIGFDGVKPIAVDRPHYPLSQHKCPVSGIQIGGPKRGILKRNARGCRGLCTCLNCTSFRLHAERAFEFSRNQMGETEELVLELVNELSCLRNVLEASADLAHDCHLNQVKEACKKASEAEEVAKSRLSHMNYDLDVHCRINCLERPRVTFANRVQEHLIPKPKPSFET